MSIIEKISKLKLKHHYCDDSFYSCPKHEDGCADKAAGDTCNCGADDHNRIVDEVISGVASLEIFLAVDYDVTEEEERDILANAGYDITEVRAKARRLVDALLATSPLNPKNQKKDK